MEGTPEGDPRRSNAATDRTVAFLPSSSLSLTTRSPLTLANHRRGDDGGDVVHAVPTVPRVQGSAHGGGEARDRVRGVHRGDASFRGVTRVTRVQDQPHAQHDAVVREEVKRDEIEPRASAYILARLGAFHARESFVFIRDLSLLLPHGKDARAAVPAHASSLTSSACRRTRSLFSTRASPARRSAEETLASFRGSPSRRTAPADRS